MRLSVSALRFGIVGLVATLIHVASATALISLAGFHPALSNGLAFVFANTFSYGINTLWSFETSLSGRIWRRFVIVSLVAWLLTVSIAWAVQLAGGHYLLGITCVVVFVSILTFTAHRRWTYAGRSQ